jgi:Rhs element Vgr protein
MGVVTVTILSSGIAMNPSFEVVTIDVVKEANRIPYAILTLLDGDPAKQTFAISDDPFFEPGKDVEIKLRWEGEPDSEASVFKGLVVKQVVEANAQGTWLTVEMKDAALKMTQTRRSAVYIQKTDSDIFGELIGKNGLKKGRLTVTQPKHPEIVQFYCSDWDFLLSRADLYGNLVISEDGEISVKEIKIDGNAKFSYTFGISEIFGFEIEVDGSHQYASVESIAWDPKNQKLTQASKAKSFNLSQGNLRADSIANLVGGKVQSLSSAVPLDPRTLQTWADGAMIKSRLSMIRGTISTVGTGKIQRMDVIEVAGVGKHFNGKTIVTGVHHRVDQNGWRTDVQFGLSAERYITSADVMDRPAAGQMPGVNGLQIGIVTSLDDPDKESRVKVILPGIDETKGEVWARLAAPDAGKGRGFFFRPEKGDEVIVGFFNDDPRQAVILGAMYSSKNTPPNGLDKDSKKNVDKGIVSRGGTSLTFSDKDKPSVVLQTPAANKITLDDDGQLIEIKDQHGNTITMSKDGITIKSAKDFKIDASGNVEIKGSKVDVK